MQLSPSDWLQIVLSLVGFLVGALLSWVFYRAQQNTDFSKLRDSIHEIGRFTGTLNDSVKQSSDAVNRIQNSYDARLSRIENNISLLTKSIAEIKLSSDFSRKIDESKEIASLRLSIDNLHKTVNNVADNIISEVRGQQKFLSGSIQEDFRNQSREALSVISSHLQREIGGYFQSDRSLEIVLQKVNTTVEQAIDRMGEYQLKRIEEKNQLILTSVRETTNRQTRVVQNKIDEIAKDVNRLALPAPK